MQAGPHALPHAPPPHTRTNTHFLAPTTTLLVACPRGKSQEESTSSTLACRVVRERSFEVPRFRCLLSCTASFVEMLRDAGSSISAFARLTHSLPATRYSLLATRYSLLATRTSQHPLAPLRVACSLFWAASHLWLNAVPRHSPLMIHPDHMDIVPPTNRYGVSWPISNLTSPMMWGWR